MQTFYKVLRNVWPYVGCVVGSIALIEGFGKTIPEVLAFIGAYLLKTNTLWLIVAVFSFFTVYTELRHRHTPLTAMSTDIEVAYLDPAGHMVRLSRTQKLRANREDVTGYVRKTWSEGVVDVSEAECTMSHSSQHTLEWDTTNRGTEMIHRFPPIPRDFFRLGTTTVKRTERMLVRDGFLGDKESYEIEIPVHYRHHRVAVSVLFHPERTCKVGKCKAIRISAHGITDLPLTHATGTQHGIRFEAKNLVGGERFRVEWHFA